MCFQLIVLIKYQIKGQLCTTTVCSKVVDRIQSCFIKMYKTYGTVYLIPK